MTLHLFFQLSNYTFPLLPPPPPHPPPFPPPTSITSPSCVEPADSGSWGSVGGPVPQWLWPWLCASLWLSLTFGAQWLPHNLHAHSSVGERRGSSKGSRRGRSEKFKYECRYVRDTAAAAAAASLVPPKHNKQHKYILVRCVWRPSGSRRWTQLFCTILRIPLGLFVHCFGNTSEAARLSRPPCLILFLTGALQEKQIKMT